VDVERGKGPESADTGDPQSAGKWINNVPRLTGSGHCFHALVLSTFIASFHSFSYQ
jgi:hypothetical protein